MPKLKENPHRIKPEAAAAEIGCHVQYLRERMKDKSWDLGRVVPPKKRGGKYEYWIFRAKLDKFLGIERTGYESS